MNIAGGATVLAVLRALDMTTRQPGFVGSDTRLWWLMLTALLAFSIGFYRDFTNWQFVHDQYEKVLLHGYCTAEVTQQSQP